MSDQKQGSWKRLQVPVAAAEQANRNARVAIVTGASSGIGEASARSLAARGFKVLLAARRLEAMERIAKEIEASGGHALPVATDLGDEEQTRALAQRALDTYGRVDVLLNNAGYAPAGALEDVPRDEIRRVFEVNLFGGLQLAGELAPIMRDQGGGRIINMSSIAARVPAPLAVLYGATKGAIESATNSLRIEVSPWKIHCSLVIPGFVATDTFDNTREWSEPFREDPSNPYQKLFLDMDDFATGQLRSAITPHDVGEVVALAATARRPRERYYVPLSSRIQGSALSMLPDRVSDFVLRRVYGVHKLG